MGTRVDVDGRPMYPWEVGGTIVGDPAPEAVEVEESAVEVQVVVEDDDEPADEDKPKRRR